MPGRKFLNTYPKKKVAIRYMVNGLTSQLITKVRITGLGVFPAFITSAKSIFTIIGYIIKNRHIAIGIDTLAIAMPSKVLAAPGATLPKNIPAIMHINTQKVKYLSKKFSFLSFCITFSICLYLSIPFKAVF